MILLVLLKKLKNTVLSARYRYVIAFSYVDPDSVYIPDPVKIESGSALGKQRLNSITKKTKVDQHRWLA